MVHPNPIYFGIVEGPGFLKYYVIKSGAVEPKFYLIIDKEQN